MAKGKALLTEAMRLLAAGEGQPALLALLAVWKETRAPAVALRIEALSDEVLPSLPPVDLAAHSSASKAIDARMKSAGPLDVGPLIIAIERFMRTAPNAFGVLVRLAAEFPDDPRVSSALHRIVLSPPFARTEGALYGRVILALETCADPRYLPDIVEWSARLEQRRRFIRKERGDLDTLRDVAARVARKKPVKVPGWVDEVLGAAPRTPSGSRDGSALLAAIYAEPSDTAARLVYADFLSERGDVRGEFISLQCNRAVDAKPSARERALLKNHGREWLGALDSGIRKQGLVYRRGFPAEARECASPEQQAEPAWATLEALELDVLTWAERAVVFVDRLPNLERLFMRAEDATFLREVKPRLTVLGLRSVTAEELAKVLASPCFPSLKQLDLDLSGAGFAAVSTHSGWKRLERVRLTRGVLTELPAFRGVVPVLEVVDGGGLADDGNGWCLRFSGPRLERLHLSTTDKKPNMYWLGRTLATLPAKVVEVVTADENVPLADPALTHLQVRVEVKSSGR